MTNLSTEMKNSTYGLNIRTDQTRAQITKLRLWTEDFSQNEAHKAT